MKNSFRISHEYILQNHWTDKVNYSLSGGNQSVRNRGVRRGEEGGDLINITVYRG